MMRPSPEFRALLLDYLIERSPVDASFIGLHQADRSWPDLSEEGLQSNLSALNDLEQSLRETPADEDSWSRIDRLLIEGHLKIQRWEQGVRRTWRCNPCYYTGEAVWGIMGLFLTPYAPLPERVASATARLKTLPRFLEQARRNLGECPQAWRARALREITGGLIFLREGIPCVNPKLPGRKLLLQAATTAAAALEDFGRRLDDLAGNGSPEGYACGEEGLELLLRQGHFLHLAGWDAASILEYAGQELEKARQELDGKASRLGGEASQLLAQLAGLHPTEATYYDRFQQIWNQARERTLERDLLTWPDFPIRFVPRPQWARKAAPYLYFLFYRSPAAFGAPSPHQYLVEPLEPALPAEARREVLRRHNDCVIKLNHVVHHGGLGHHIQNWHAARSPSLVGRIAAVDCASRIALLCGGTMAEGWACYATDLMREAGFLSPLEELAEQQSRLRMCARAIVDVRLHQGRMSLAEAIRYYQNEAGMPPAAAEGEAVKNSLFPATGLMYLMGTDTLHVLRREVAGIERERFRLGRFHDELLSYGSLPVALIRQEMLQGSEGSR